MKRLPISRTALRLALAMGAALAAAPPAGGLETDQYLAWQVELRDSAGALNDFVNSRITESLAKPERGKLGDGACEELPPKLLRSLFRTTSLPSKLRRFLSADGSLDRHPGPDTGYWRYLGESLFRAPAFPFIMPMARTIRVGDVDTGTDKIGHIFGFGRRYYRRYRAALDRGLDEDEALRRVVRWGVRIERYLAGGVLDGVFSYADVEANYQGLRLALDLCGADPPHLARREGRWVLARPIDLTDYVTPHFDESYYNSHFSDHRWKSIRSILEGYCELYRSPSIQARRARYRREAGPSPSMRIVAEFFAEQGNDRQQRHSIEAVCGDAPAATGARLAVRR